jgi:tetratricopeptide (TPR) repeat protein
VEGVVARLREAQELDPALAFDPEAEARALTVASLIATGKSRARAGDVDGAIESLQKARELKPALALNPETAAVRWSAAALIERGDRLVAQGKAKEALAAYEAAQEADPTLRISAASWNSLCWWGSLRGYGADVMAACERAVTLVPESGFFRWSRGLARVLTGDYAGAIADIKLGVEGLRKSELMKPLVAEWQAKLAALEAGRNPFDPATLEALRLRELE